MSSKSIGVWNRPWLWLPSKLSHDISPYVLPLIAGVSPDFDNRWGSFNWQGLEFKNPLGIAGGVDKTGQSLGAWKKLGAGFLEVGTVTPEPQGPNPGLIMSRDTSRQALWNKMGFPNAGTQVLLNRLSKFETEGLPLFINVGKNRWTDNSEAHKDYLTCIDRMKEHTDVFVVNVSSPNTKGLRDLLSEAELTSFLNALMEGAEKVAPGKKYLLKLSPDMDSEVVESALNVSAPFVHGWILTNTTKQRYPGCPFPADEGGVSGLPLTELSREALKIAADAKSRWPDKLIVSVGGISSAEEIKRRLDMGADLVQFYSALVFEGPGFFRQSIEQLRCQTQAN